MSSLSAATAPSAYAAGPLQHGSGRQKLQQQHPQRPKQARQHSSSSYSYSNSNTSNTSNSSYTNSTNSNGSSTNSNGTLAGRALEAARDRPPTLALYLYPQHFTLGHLGGMYEYESVLGVLVDMLDSRSPCVPADIVQAFHEAQCPFYLGHIVAEVHDYRPQAASQAIGEAAVSAAVAPEPVASAPAAEPAVRRVAVPLAHDELAAEIAYFSQQLHIELSPAQALAAEAQLLVDLGEPLELDPAMIMSTHRASRARIRPRRQSAHATDAASA
ncbi:hypothetical protein GQ42DRAFT_159713 [Ramicandelaber brevisporus]|nr:hypothetical protein GQ42DRAFT_159713 [Ramicandelaber brevisporus]